MRDVFSILCHHDIGQENKVLIPLNYPKYYQRYYVSWLMWLNNNIYTVVFIYTTGKMLTDISGFCLVWLNTASD